MASIVNVLQDEFSRSNAGCAGEAIFLPTATMRRTVELLNEISKSLAVANPVAQVCYRIMAGVNLLLALYSLTDGLDSWAKD